ncbi:MAG: TlpA disulfide reductase family protein [Sediminibacterium sp.]|nr:TlpA disulfide reductase family protein [Sediminibacterium sp.]
MKIIALLFLFVVSINLKAQFEKKPFVIHGEIKNQSTGYIRLDYIDYKGIYVQDSARINDGRFEFRGDIAHPVRADIYGERNFTNTNDINFNSIFIEPGIMHLSVEKDKFKYLSLKGSKTQKQIDSLDNAYLYKKLKDSLERRIYDFNLAYKLNPANKYLKDSTKNIHIQLDPHSREVIRMHIDFTIKNTKSYYSVDYLQILLHRLPLDSVKRIFNSYSDELQTSYYGQKIAEDIRALEGGGPGAKAKNFVAVDQNGNQFSLEQFKGKNYVLLDFWATWCVPCRSESPFLVELNAKFKSKGLQIISIADDDDRKLAWKKAIQDDKTGDWMHVLKGAGTDHDLGKLYGIQPIPTKILIGKDGTILMRYEGTNENKMLMDALTKNLK